MPSFNFAKTKLEVCDALRAMEFIVTKSDGTGSYKHKVWCRIWESSLEGMRYERAEKLVAALNEAIRPILKEHIEHEVMQALNAIQENKDE